MSYEAAFLVKRTVTILPTHRNAGDRRIEAAERQRLGRHFLAEKQKRR